MGSTGSKNSTKHSNSHAEKYCYFYIYITVFSFAELLGLTLCEKDIGTQNKNTNTLLTTFKANKETSLVHNVT